MEVRVRTEEEEREYEACMETIRTLDREHEAWKNKYQAEVDEWRAKYPELAACMDDAKRKKKKQRASPEDIEEMHEFSPDRCFTREKPEVDQSEYSFQEIIDLFPKVTLIMKQVELKVKDLTRDRQVMICDTVGTTVYPPLHICLHAIFKEWNTYGKESEYFVVELPCFGRHIGTAAAYIGVQAKGKDKEPKPEATTVD